MLTSALAYVDQGLPVFPCDPATKRPLTPSGFKNATIDRAAITFWWTTWPSAMIGMPTGETSNCFVLDVDVDAKKKLDGSFTLAVLTERNGALPATATQVTPRGGRHYFFTHPRTKVKNSAGKLGDGLDVRGDGGYVILAPSRNTRGGQYVWTSGGNFEQLAPAPEWLLRLIVADLSTPPLSQFGERGSQRAIQRELEAVASAAQGQRNEALNRAAFNLARLVQAQSLTRKKAEEALFQASTRSGLVEDDGSEAVIATITSGMNAGLAAAPAKAASQKRLLAGEEIELNLPEAWPEQVDGAALLDAIAQQVRRYVVLGSHEALAVALWILHTYCFDAFYITPRLLIRSPVRGCGKTTLVDVLAELTARGMRTSSLTAPVLFRTVGILRPTLLIDEADTFLRDDDALRGILNDGYRRGGRALRLVGDEHELRGFNTFSPVAVAGLGTVHDTIASRSIVIELRRKLPAETTESFRADRTQHFKDLARQCVRWCADNITMLGTLDPSLPAGLFNREADNWRPLVALADSAGGNWPSIARAAAVGLMQGTGDERSPSVRLLIDIKAVFDGRATDKMSSAELCADLAKMEGAPWAEMKNGKAITPNQLAHRLKDFGIAPGTIRIGDDTPKGYQRAQFDDAFVRYLPAEPPQRHNVSAIGISEQSGSATSAQVWRLESPQKANGSGPCGVVAPSEPPLNDDQEERAAIVNFDGTPSGGHEGCEGFSPTPAKEAK